MSEIQTAGTSASPIERLALVVVTYKRQEMLANLFDSIAALDDAPWRIVIVDNENSPATKQMVAKFNERCLALWGHGDETDTEGSADQMCIRDRPNPGPTRKGRRCPPPSHPRALPHP